MSPLERPRVAPRVAYVVKRYPRYSETFIVNEILAHEAAGLELEIFALYPPLDTHFQDAIAKVRAPVHYLIAQNLTADELWGALQEASEVLPELWEKLEYTKGKEAVNVFRAVRLAKAVRERGITHLHAHFANAAATVARLAAHFAGVTYSVTAHAKDIFHEEVNEASLAQKLRDAAAVVTVSDFNVRDLERRFGPLNLRRVYNGLDLAKFPFTSPLERPKTIVAVGRLVEKKGFADLLNACALLAARGERFRCLVVGTGELAGALRRQVRALGLEGCVELVGPRPQGEVVSLIREASAFAAPCVVAEDGNRDGLPTVLLEAMALGTPCVSTDVTGIPEVLRHKETGLRVPQRDPVALADALARLLNDGALRARLARGARALIEREFDVTKNAARLRELFAAAPTLQPTHEEVV